MAKVDVQIVSPQVGQRGANVHAIVLWIFLLLLLGGLGAATYLVGLPMYRDYQAAKKTLQEGDAKKDQQIKDLQGQLAKAQAEVQKREKEAAALRATYDRLAAGLKKWTDAGSALITFVNGRLTVNLSDRILFDSGKAEVKPEGKQVLSSIAPILQEIKDYEIQVQGHTDNEKVGGALLRKYPTNWELSTARATQVTEYLQSIKVDPERLSAAGYSEYRPVADNAFPEGKAKNRRIEIVLLPLEVPQAPDVPAPAAGTQPPPPAPGAP